MTMDAMPAYTTRHGHRPGGWHALKWVIIITTVLLAPVFFAVMYLTVTHLLADSFGRWAWTVPVATETCFVIAYLLGILLEWAHKPMDWLRYVPWLFAAASLTLNVWASLGDPPGMIGHAVVTVAFFLPLIAGEAAVRSLSRSEDDIARAAELGDALRYARDLARDRKGRLWRWRIPSLLRNQIRHKRPPASVTTAVAEGARYGGASAWERAVEDWLATGLTRGEQMDATVAAKRDAIAATMPAPQDVPPARQLPRHRARQNGQSDRARANAKAARLLTANPAMAIDDVARQAGVSPRTVSRIKSGLPRQLHVAEG
jgi:hypothetical protein